MALSDGHVAGNSMVLDNGPASRRFNLVIISEGYRAEELGTFANNVNDFIAFLFSLTPFNTLKCALNVYRIDVASDESGADDPVTCGGTGALKATMFDASFCNGGIRRLLCVNESNVLNIVQSYVPEWHQILVIVNSPVYGGSGGSITVTSTGGSWKKVAVHEMGHSIFGLADEYPYWSGCAVDTTNNNYTGPEPVYPNITITTDRNTIKWKDQISASTAVPTTLNPDCSHCDTQSDPMPAGTTGAYEGAYYFHCGIFRPEFRCMMYDLSGFCAVCRKRIEKTLTPFLEKCYAPVFRPFPLIVCVLIRILLIIILFILFVSTFLSDRMNCLFKRTLFLFKHCHEGNSDQCISL